ncbi:MAG: glycosyltransferase family 9 protein [Lentisphaerae bacterium]|nr:glycosyltransferase family 9 protein [Lentisphaerota bacterium]MCP4102702.1 glycosyltransferase family 9 protein [Lentisphaerota bacterium]
MLTAVADNATRDGKKISFYYLTSRKNKVQSKNMYKLELLSNNPDIAEVLVESRVKFCLRRFCRSVRLEKNYVYFPLRRFTRAYMAPIKGQKYHFNLLSSGKHGIKKFCEKAGVSIHTLKPKVFLTNDEKRKADKILKENSLLDKTYIIVETGTLLPDSNKAWPEEYWQELFFKIRNFYPHYKLVQISPGQQSFYGVTDISGQTSFRESLRFVQRAAASITTEGALVHASAAFYKPSVVMVSRCMDPGLSTYPKHQQLFVHNGLQCAGCGVFNECQYDRKCMKEISPAKAFSAVEKMIKHHNIY